VELCAYFYQHNQFDFGKLVKPWPSTMTIIPSVKNMSVRVDGHVSLHRKGPNSKEMEDNLLDLWKAGFEILDSLADMSANNVHLTIVARTNSWRPLDSVETDAHHFRTTLEELFLRLVRLRDAEYWIKMVFQPADGHFQLHTKKLICTPGDAEFSVDGYMRKWFEVC
jgi:hypothetical protein